MQRRCAGARAHPRSRGEHIENPKARLPSPGSSPLARGTRKEALEVIQLTGLIPARAGNTQSPEQQFRSLRAHPRSRGEHQLLRRADSPSLGSSPLARGTRLLVMVTFRVRGLIPARAGNTTMSKLNYHAQTAHPRSRGEHPRILRRARPCWGSSPLARGTRAVASCVCCPEGLIPARAGNTGVP